VAVAVLFPGQGSQFAGMGDPWTEHATGRAVLAEASEAIGRDVVEGCRDEAALATTGFVQPALLACDIAAFRVAEAEGLRAQAAAGHSLGEFAALVAAGALDLSTALRLVVVRGRAMQQAADANPGTMIALVGAGPEAAAQIRDAVASEDDVLTVANENASNQTVLSGSPEAIARAEEEAKLRRVRAIRLNVAGAFHSPLMRSAVDPIAAALAEATFSRPAFPIVTNVTGTFVENPDDLRSLLERHVVSPVRWMASIRALAAAGFDTFVEAGPGQVLTKIVTRELASVRAVAVGSPAAALALAAGTAEKART
jgi:[acyl-carrier-protein] S-malonyltransferase